MKSEVPKVTKQSKQGKAVVPDEIYIKLIKLLNDENIDALVEIFYNTEISEISHNWLQSTFIPIP